MDLTLSCSAFDDGGRIPARFTCEGQDLSPPLEWSGVPDGTRSLTLVCGDPDAPGGTWYHWAVFDIPMDTNGLEEAYPADAQVGATRQAVTDFRRTGYGGPCPPKGHGVHRYRFHLMALDVTKLPVSDTPDCREVENAAKDHTIAETVLTGTYSR
jgi:hypothetical protein